MDHLKEGIRLRGYGQKDPLVAYKKGSYTLFQDMMDRIEDETVRYLYFLRFEQNQGACHSTTTIARMKPMRRKKIGSASRDPVS